MKKMCVLLASFLVTIVNVLIYCVCKSVCVFLGNLDPLFKFYILKLFYFCFKKSF